MSDSKEKEIEKTDLDNTGESPELSEQTNNEDSDSSKNAETRDDSGNQDGENGENGEEQENKLLNNEEITRLQKQISDLHKRNLEILESEGTEDALLSVNIEKDEIDFLKDYLTKLTKKDEVREDGTSFDANDAKELHENADRFNSVMGKISNNLENVQDEEQKRKLEEVARNNQEIDNLSNELSEKMIEGVDEKLLEEASEQLNQTSNANVSTTSGIPPQAYLMATGPILACMGGAIIPGVVVLIVIMKVLPMFNKQKKQAQVNEPDEAIKTFKEGNPLKHIGTNENPGTPTPPINIGTKGGVSKEVTSAASTKLTL